MQCGVVVRVSHNTFRWFGYIERMTQSEINEKKAYMNMIDAMNARGRPTVK